MYNFLKILALTPLLVACTNNIPKSINTLEINQPLPAPLMVKCSDYDSFQSSDIKDIIITHAENMEKAIKCKDRHNQLVETINDRQE